MRRAFVRLATEDISGAIMKIVHCSGSLERREITQKRNTHYYLRLLGPKWRNKRVGEKEFIKKNKYKTHAQRLIEEVNIRVYVDRLVERCSVIEYGSIRVRADYRAGRYNTVAQ